MDGFLTSPLEQSRIPTDVGIRLIGQYPFNGNECNTPSHVFAMIVNVAPGSDLRMHGFTYAGHKTIISFSLNNNVYAMFDDRMSSIIYSNAYGLSTVVAFVFG